MAESYSNLIRRRYVGSLCLVGFSLIVLFMMLGQVPNLAASGPVQYGGVNSTMVPTQYQPTMIGIMVETTTVTQTNTLLSTTTSVSMSTLTQTVTQTATITSVSTSTAGIGGLDPSMNMPLLVISLIIGAIIGAIAVGAANLNSSRSNYRKSNPKPPPSPSGMAPLTPSATFCPSCGGKLPIHNTDCPVEARGRVLLQQGH